MRHAQSIFHDRLGEAWAKGLRYFLLIGGNGGMPILIILAGILLFYAYRAFLSWLPGAFPTYLLLAMIMSVVLTKSSVRTFIQKPDVVFLLPLEHRMSAYFRHSFIYSAVVQAVFASIAMGLLLPLYRVTIGDQTSFFVALGFIVLFKVWNVYAYWQELHLSFGRGRHIAFRFVVNLLLTSLLFYGGALPLYTLITAVMLFIMTVYYKRITHKSRYPWYRFVELEQKRLNTLYTLTSLFVDVPHLQQQVKQRRWLNALLTRLPYKQRNSTLYLYTRTFARSGEYLGLYVRLTAVTAIVMAFAPNVYVVLAGYVIGLVFTGVQLPAVSKKHADSIWLRLYPLNPIDRQKGISQLTLILLSGQSVLLTIVYVFRSPSTLFVVGLLAVGLLFSYGYSFVYLPRRLAP